MRQPAEQSEARMRQPAVPIEARTRSLEEQTVLLTRPAIAGTRCILLILQVTSSQKPSREKSRLNVRDKTLLIVITS